MISISDGKKKVYLLHRGGTFEDDITGCVKGKLNTYTRTVLDGLWFKGVHRKNQKGLMRSCKNQNGNWILEQHILRPLTKICANCLNDINKICAVQTFSWVLSYCCRADAKKRDKKNQWEGHVIWERRKTGQTLIFALHVGVWPRKSTPYIYLYFLAFIYWTVSTGRKYCMICILCKV